MPTFLDVVPAKWVQNGYTIVPGAHPIFVHGALPGEQVRVRITKKTAHHSFASVEQVLKSSDERITSDCAAFPECGGCSFRHIAYEKEVEIKKNLLLEFRPLGGMLGDLAVFTSQPNGYRSHVRIQHSGSAPGFFAMQSSRVVEMPHNGCPNLSPEMNRAVQNFFESFQDGPRGKKGWDGYRFREADRIYGPDHRGSVPLRIEQPGDTVVFQTPVDGFVQANRFLLGDWIRTICSWIPAGCPDTLELYAGCGFIGGCARSLLGSYEGAELSESSVRAARENFQRLGLAGSFSAVDLERTVPDPRPLCIVNPARSGLSSAVRNRLCERIVKTIVYSSCNPATLNRDAADLMAAGFSITKSAMFDFFPRTPHVEVVVVLERT